MIAWSFKKVAHHLFANYSRIILTVFILIFSVTGFTQTGTISGTVVENPSTPLAGATIKIKGSNKATITNEQGEFSLNNVPASGTLVISYVGFLPYEIKYFSGTKVTVALTKTVTT